MAAEPDKGAIAFHLVMALCSSLAVNDDPHLANAMATLGRLLEDAKHPEDQAELRAAYDALLTLSSPAD